MVYEFLELFYVYDVLELYIDKEIMIIYYMKYYNIYVINLNKVVEGNIVFVNKLVEEFVVDFDFVFENICIVVCNNGGGYVNYKLFWIFLFLNGGGELIGVFVDDINSVFGSFDKFKE